VPRLFVACVPSASTRAALALEVQRLVVAAPALRVVGADDLHLTLAFLGATPDDRVPSLCAALAPVAAAAAPFAITVEGLGAFPSFRTPRAIWAGLTGDAGTASAIRLAKRVARVCADVGCPAAARGTFQPHVTLGRSDGRRPEPALEMLLTVGALQGTYIPEVLSDLLLMVSETDVASSGAPDARRPGSRYRVLATWPFGGGAGSPSAEPGDGTNETDGGTRAR